jgi:DNA-binding NarL/FixJ family response regulator
MVEPGNGGGRHDVRTATLLRRLAAPAREPPLVTTVYVVADVRLYRDGLVQALGQAPGIDVAGAAASLAEALAGISARAPEAVLLDVSMPGSQDAVRGIAAAAPATRVVALSIADRESDVLAFAEAGVSGYVTRDAGLDELVAALEGAVRGDVVCSPSIAGALLRRVTTLAARVGDAPAARMLTSRELEIVDLIGGGLSNKEIAGRLHIEVATVKNHVHNILEKLQVPRRGDAVAVVRAGRTYTAED